MRLKERDGKKKTLPNFQKCKYMGLSIETTERKYSGRPSGKKTNRTIILLKIVMRKIFKRPG